MADYWIERDGARLGPFDEARILDDYNRGLLSSDDRLWVEGLEDWVTVEAAFAELRRDPDAPESLSLTPLEVPPETDSGPAATDTPAHRDAREEVARSHQDRGDFGYPYAGFWVRYGAVAIDSLITTLLFLAILAVLVYLSGLFGAQLMYSDARLNTLSLVVSWLYYAGLESGVHNATLGKRLFKLQVLRAEDHTGISFFLATARFGVSLLSLLLFAIGYLMQPFTPKKQALHDLATSTVVIVRAPYSRVLLGVVITVPIAIVIVSFVVGILVAMNEGLQ